VGAFDNLHIVSLIGLAGILESVGGLLILFGVFTREAAFILSGEMAVAYFKVFAAKSVFPLLNGGEAAVFFCFAFLYLSGAGAGPWSIDAFLSRRKVHPLVARAR